jgi:signal transduction histidine kinase
MLKTVKTGISRGNPPSPEKINEISDLVYDATMICRKITKGLPMQSVGHDNLLLAIDQLAINVRNLYQMNCEFISQGDVSVIDDLTSSQLYFIFQEAVNKRGKTQWRGEYKDLRSQGKRLIQVSVQDDGKGRGTSGTEGLGLNIMNTGLTLIGGVFMADNTKREASSAGGFPCMRGAVIINLSIPGCGQGILKAG